ncbi:MAG: glucoamylase family protein [Anaerolineae bacterium]
MSGKNMSRRKLLKMSLGVAGAMFLGALRGSPALESQPTVLFPGEAPSASGASPRLSSEPEEFLKELAEATWTYLSSPWATTHHLPWSWRSEADDLADGGDYANTTEIGFYALCWLAAYDLQRPWSPSWTETEDEVSAVLDQLRAWQTGSQSEEPYGPNAYENSVFYQWYWISEKPPVVGADDGKNQLVPSVDNAWLAASLIVIREYAQANGHPSLAQKADAILESMDFMLWYDYNTHLFYWGDIQESGGGDVIDYYSSESRIINFVARALGQLPCEEFLLSLEALEQSAVTYEDITVDKASWNGAYFLYTSPALFIREMGTSYGAHTITPATQAQIAYARNEGYDAWGFSDCFDVKKGGYVNQGAPPVAMPDPPETRPGLVTPHANALALITPLASEAITNLRTISDTFPCAYDSTYGFYDSVMVDPEAADHGQCSYRFSALAQEWMFLALANYQKGFVWDYYYRDAGVVAAHREVFGDHQIYLPLVMHAHAGAED